jgi:hypothetical protein
MQRKNNGYRELHPGRTASCPELKLELWTFLVRLDSGYFCIVERERGSDAVPCPSRSPIPAQPEDKAQLPETHLESVTRNKGTNHPQGFSS